MRYYNILDHYLLREWRRIFLITALGFPIIVIAIELTDKLDRYLSRGLSPKTIAMSYLFAVPDKIFMILPAAVLFATVFSIGSMGRHSELTAAKASGRSFHRLVAPVLLAGLFATFAGLVLAEIAPPATRRQLELLGERRDRTQPTRYNFVYRADEGWVYTIRSLEIEEGIMRDIVLAREGVGEDYPTLAVQAYFAQYVDSLNRWRLGDGHLRVVAGEPQELTFVFDSMYHRGLVESPADLLAEPKAPEEMRYGELARYIKALERSGADTRKLRVDHSLKIAIPVTCLVIAFFGAPLAITSPRASGALGIAISLGTTIMFLTLIQLSRAVGSGGVLPPTLAAWMPNAVFGSIGLVLFVRAPT